MEKKSRASTPIMMPNKRGKGRKEEDTSREGAPGTGGTRTAPRATRASWRARKCKSGGGVEEERAGEVLAVR